MRKMEIKYRPSGMKRVIQCPASITHNQGDNNIDTKSMAFRGNVIHEMAEKAINKEVNSFEDGQVLTVLDHEYKINQDMIDEAFNFYIYVNNVLSSMLEDKEYYSEKFVKILDKDGIPLQGTIDFVAFDDETLHIVDLKTGRTPVNARWNPQLLSYAYGAIQFCNNRLYFPKKIVLHIVQDNAMIHNTNIWGLSSETLNEYIANTIKPVIGDYITYNTGDECTYCNHRDNCKELYNSTVNTINSVLNTDNNCVTDEQRVNILALEKNFNILLKAYKENLQDKLLQGETIAGIKLIQSKSRKSWVEDENLVKSLKWWASKDKIPVLNEPTLRTPTQLYKELYPKLTTRTQNAFNALVKPISITPKVVLNGTKGEPYVLATTVLEQEEEKK